MLQSELSKTKYNKAAHNRILQQKIGRSKFSIEFKHQNVSAVLKGLGEVWINGYKPAFNYQASLVEAVVDLSRFDAAPLIAFTAPKEKEYGTETDG